MDKHDYRAAREAARVACAALPETAAGLRVQVSTSANVQPCDGGAFVEAMIWVPEAVFHAS